MESARGKSEGGRGLGTKIRRCAPRGSYHCVCAHVSRVRDVVVEQICVGPLVHRLRLSVFRIFAGFTGEGLRGRACGCMYARLSSRLISILPHAYGNSLKETNVLVASLSSSAFGYLLTFLFIYKHVVT